MVNRDQKNSILIYDGDCGFCKRCVNAWKELTQNQFLAGSSQEVASQYPQVPPSVYQDSVVYVAESGEYWVGAQAVFRSLVQHPRLKWAQVLLKIYQKNRMFSKLTEWGYRRVAQNRIFFSWLSWILWGEELGYSYYRISQKIFLSSLGMIYGIAFISLKTQILGLVGSHGILASPFSDFQLQGMSWAGILASLSLMLGFAQRLSLIVLLCLYFCLVQVCQDFLGFQWDGLLLEMGFLALFFVPDRKNPNQNPSRASLFLLRWLLFRVMFFSGWVKLASGDPHWRDGSALSFHFETQPLPTWIGWYLHQLPDWVLRGMTWAMFGVELGVPFLIFLPRNAKLLAFFIFFVFQLLIDLSGNYGFFGLEVIALSVLLIDDRFWQNRFRWIQLTESPSNSKTSAVSRLSMVSFASFLFLISLFPSSMFGRILGALGLVNSYGVFAVMTTHRDEIEIQVSQNGQDWDSVEFKWKPGPLDQPPQFVEPHMPRLDWLMWFAALSEFDQNPWFEKFLLRLLEGSPQVLGLLKPNSLFIQPPLWVRAVRYRYHFTGLETKMVTGNWWRRDFLGEYSPRFQRSKK